MSDTDVVPAAPAAPEADVTATPPSEVVQPEAPPVEAAPKTFTQEELDAAIGKRLAREQRKWEREQAAKATQAPPRTSETPPKSDQFETPEAYAEALAKQMAHEMVSKRDQERQQVELMHAYAEREEVAMEKYEDFRQVAYNESLQITPVMAATIRASEMGPDLAYHLGTNPKEAARIAQLSDFLQAKELGRLEAKLAASPPTKKTSTAPAPIAPVNARGGSEKSFDTTDSRSIAAMSTSEWIAADNARLMKKLRSQG